ncbi:MAG: RluA family pseudouridine synthase [Gemmobacter sp.]
MTDPSRILRVTLGSDASRRLDKALAEEVPEEAGLSRSRIARLIEAGAVRQGGVVLGAKSQVDPGLPVEIELGPPEPDGTPAEAIPLSVIYEDDDLIVIDKPPGLVVHPAVGNPRGTLVNALLHHCDGSLSGIGGTARPGIVHRIDKDTSGLLVAAKSDRAHHGLAAQFEAHSVSRHYLALVHGRPDPGDPRMRNLPGLGVEPGGVIRIATRIGRHRTDRQRQAVLAAGGRDAVTRFRVVEGFGTPPAVSLIDCWLETGRTHQIRVHLSHVGHPLVGDRTYGNRRRAPARLGAAPDVDGFARQALHAATLGFDHPVTGARMNFSAPLPPDLSGLLQRLRSG